MKAVSREDPREDVGVLGDFPVQLATRLPDWSSGGLLRCSAARLSMCRVVLQINRPTRTTCYGHPREDVTRKMLPWNFGLTTVHKRYDLMDLYVYWLAHFKWRSQCGHTGPSTYVDQCSVTLTTLLVDGR